MEANSTVNLVPFGSAITELQMRENRDFVVPVNMLTLFVHAPFSWAARHTTVCLDTQHCRSNQIIYQQTLNILDTRT